NAEIMVPEAEWAFWNDDANLRAAPEGLKIVFHNVRRIFADIAKDVTHYRPGKEVTSGIETVDAAGHTPGHTVFALQSGKDSLMVLSDTTQHPALFARHPEWQPQFDIDGAQAVAGLLSTVATCITIAESPVICTSTLSPLALV